MLPYERHERDIAVLMDGRLSVSSGRTPSDAGDGKNYQFLWDCKYTDKKYYTLSANTWKKVFDEANREYREPLVIIRLIDYDLVVRMVGVRPKKTSLKSTRIKGPCSITLAGLKVEYDLVVEELDEWIYANKNKEK